MHAAKKLSTSFAPIWVAVTVSANAYEEPGNIVRVLVSPPRLMQVLTHDA